VQDTGDLFGVTLDYVQVNVVVDEDSLSVDATTVRVVRSDVVAVEDDDEDSDSVVA
jgi:hypothetical protein